MDALKFLTSQRNWECRLSPDGIKIYAPSQRQAMWACEEFFDDLALTALKFYGKVTLSSVQNPDLSIEIHDFMWRSGAKDIMNNIIHPKVYLAEVKIYTPEFAMALSNLIENSDMNLGIVRLSDNVQIGLTRAMSGLLGVSDLSPNTKVRREDYWHPHDLYDFTQIWKRQLNTDGTSILEYRYRALRNSVISKTDWNSYVTKYRLLQDGEEFYHLSEVVATEPIPAPVSV
ncbi:MAG: hypothetical protein DSM106950_41425 [Stigonema ocellatum SAG 48.90 = DSM 106950]|nr:hypothetical protein [Stigonema ocellatum SAG 48.90 = DSM 106950]